jgi:hypothetical protein
MEWEEYDFNSLRYELFKVLEITIILKGFLNIKNNYFLKLSLEKKIKFLIESRHEIWYEKIKMLILITSKYSYFKCTSQTQWKHFQFNHK